MNMLLRWPESALILLAIGFFSILAMLVYRNLRGRKPDPDMTLLLALMKDFPKDQNSGSGGSGTPDHPESDEDLGPLGPGGFGSFALSVRIVRCGRGITYPREPRRAQMRLSG
jgi:hypothetical protein